MGSADAGAAEMPATADACTAAEMASTATNVRRSAAEMAAASTDMRRSTAMTSASASAPASAAFSGTRVSSARQNGR